MNKYGKLGAMDIAVFRELLTPLGQEAIQAASNLEPREVDFLTHFQSLSRHYSRQLAQASLETAILRLEAEKKFPHAQQMYLTREALQQATSYAVSQYRAQRYADFDRVLDLGCSIGGDTLALAAVAPTIGLDLDPLRLVMARANLQSLNLKANFIQANLLSPLPISLGNSALFFDPARRAAHRRIYSVRDYAPPLSIVTDWLVRFPAMGVKISPGVKLVELAAYDCELEFISLNGELKEAVLWFGSLKRRERRATILPGEHSMSSDQLDAVSCQLSDPQNYIYEPDPAILRAGLVRDLAVQLDAAQLDPDIAYLTAESKMDTPFARVWEIEAWFPFQLKRLRAYLREKGIGKVVVKKRGSPLQPEQLIRDLRLKGDFERVLFLTHLNGKPIVVIGIPI